MYLLELRGICKSYRRGGFFGAGDRFEVLKNIDMGIDKGSCPGLLGKSGCGKSTLSRIALGLEPPDAGELYFRGSPVKGLKRDAYRDFRRNVQVVFQNSLGAVNPRMTAGQIVAEPILNFEAAKTETVRNKVCELLERVGLSPSDAKKYPHEFSGGELQRVCIARAISLNPELVILDEAVSSLDMLIQAKILVLLQELQTMLDMTYLFISHDIRLLLKVCTHLAVMEDGRLVERAIPMDDISSLDHPAFKNLLGAVLPPKPMSRREDGASS